MGSLNLPFSREEVNRFLRDFGVERRFFLESRQQFAHGTRVEQRARQTMLPDLRAPSRARRYFPCSSCDVRILGVVRVDQLREAQRTGHARGPSADDDNIGLHLRGA